MGTEGLVLEREAGRIVEELANAQQQAETHHAKVYEYIHAGGETQRVGSFEEFKESGCPAVKDMSEDGLRGLFELAANPVLVTNDTLNENERDHDKVKQSADDDPKHVHESQVDGNQKRRQSKDRHDSLPDIEPPTAVVAEPRLAQVPLYVRHEDIRPDHKADITADTTAITSLTGRTDIYPDIPVRIAAVIDEHRNDRLADDQKADTLVEKRQTEIAPAIHEVRVPDKYAKQRPAARLVKPSKPEAVIQKQKTMLPEVAAVVHLPAATREPGIVSSDLEVPHLMPEAFSAEGFDEAADMELETIMKTEVSQIDEPLAESERDVFVGQENHTPFVEAAELIGEDAMRVYRELLQLQLEELFDTPAPKKVEHAIIQTAEITDTEDETDAITQLESLLGVEPSEHAAVSIEAFREQVDEQDVAQAFVQLAEILPEIDLITYSEMEESPAIEIVAAINHAAEILGIVVEEALQANLPPAITPELTEKLLDLFRAMGYRNPGEELVLFLRQYDLQVLSEVIFKLRAILEAGDMLHQVHTARSSSSDDGTLLRKLGFFLNKFVTIGVKPTTAPV